MSRKYFGTDGIRDVAGEGMLAPDRVRALGRGVARWLSAPRRVLVGRDTRESGPWILDALAEGLLAAGHEVVDGGVLTTPAVQTLCREEGFDLAIVISASHNPAHDNGIKFFGRDGRKLPDHEEERLEAAIDADGPAAANPAGVKAARRDDAAAGGRYLRFLHRECFPALDLRATTLVVDCAHGAAWTLAPALLREFGATVVVRGNTPDGRNINDGVGVFHVEDLAPLVRTHGATLGLALDGDADRVLLVDEGGTVRDGDHMLGVLAADLAERGALPGRRIVTTVMANLGLKVFLRNHGVECTMVPVGDRHVAAAMDQGGAVLGGEQSGHVIFRDGARWFGDGLYTALRVLEVVRRRRTPLSRLAAGIEKYPQVLVNVRVASKPKVESVPALRDAVSAAEEVLGDEGRVLLRYSGTEPLLRVMVEGRREAEVRRLAESLADVARAALV